MAKRFFLLILVVSLAAGCTASPKHTIPIKDQFNLKAGSYRWYQINVPSTASVKGEIHSDRTINVYFMDAPEINNFKAGGTFAYYPDLSRENCVYFGLDDRIPAGNYVLVIDNTFSILTPKTVSVNVEIQY